MPSAAELKPPSTSPAHCKTAVLNTRAQVVHSLDHKPFTSHHEFAEGQHRKRSPHWNTDTPVRFVVSTQNLIEEFFLMAFSQQSTATIHFCSKCSWSQQFTADIFPSRATAELQDPLDSEVHFTNFNCSYWSLSTTWYYVLGRCFMRLLL